MPKKKLKTDKEYEQLGRMISDIYETGYMNRGRFYKLNFIKGILVGFGGVIGATIVVTFILWILSFINSVPFVGHIVTNVQNTIDSSQK